jgi:nucleoid DNA-binding protein
MKEQNGKKKIPNRMGTLTHKGAMRAIAKELDCSYYDVESVMTRFFTKFGIQWFLRKERRIAIDNFGSFSFRKRAEMKKKARNRKKQRKWYQRRKAEKASGILNKPNLKT